MPTNRWKNTNYFQKKISLWLLLFSIWIGIVGCIFSAWALWHIAAGGSRINGRLKDVLIFIALIPSNTHNILTPQNPLFFSDSNTPQGIRGITEGHAQDFLLVSLFDKNENQPVVKLIRISDNKVTHIWKPDWKKIRQWHVKPRNFSSKYDRIVHPILLTDASLIFNDDMGIYRIDKDSNFLWHNNSMIHHSIELDADSNIWCPSTTNKTIPLKNNSIIDYKDDAISKIDLKTGKFLFKKSIAEILIDNGYEGLLWGTSLMGTDPIHCNDIQPALSSTQYWQKGDLLISIRHKSTVFLYRPTTNEILWLKTGPWLNQHDCDFLNDHQVGIFGNDVTREGEAINAIGTNNQYIFDFSTNTISTPYTQFFVSSKIATAMEGRSEILPNGDIFIEETTRGRILVGDFTKVKFTFSERISKKYISTLGWSRYLTKDQVDAINFN